MRRTLETGDDAGVAATSTQRRNKRQNLVMLALASVLGLWLGIGAPSVSPVAPGPPPPLTSLAGGPP
jgi:hypothetical protein